MKKNASSSHRNSKLKINKITTNQNEIFRHQRNKINFPQEKKTFSLIDDNSSSINKSLKDILKIKIHKFNSSSRNTKLKKSILNKNKSLLLKRIKNKDNNDSIKLSQKMQNEFFVRISNSSCSFDKSMFFISPKTILKNLFLDSQYKAHYRLINHINVKKYPNKNNISISNKLGLSKSERNYMESPNTHGSPFYPKIYSCFNRNDDTQKNNNNIKNNSLERKVQRRISIVKKILKRRAKNKSMIISDAIKESGYTLLPYEKIDKKDAKKKINKKIFFNKNNLDRFIHIMKLNKEGFDEDNAEHDIIKIQKFGKNYRNSSVKLLKDSFLKTAKTKHFHQKTICKLNMYSGKYFGIPV